MDEVQIIPVTQNMRDITGQKFGRLEVLGYVGGVPTSNNKKRHIWKCLCDCGKIITTGRGNLTSGNTRSCGCWSSEVTARRNSTHGLTASDEYRIWQGMIQRCQDPGNHVYGGRGISVCQRWLKFENFYADVGPRPSKGHSLDRRDNDGNYSPGNVKWATRKEQNQNTRQNVNFTLNERTQCLSAWAEEFGKPYQTIRARIGRGWTIERALSEDIKPWGR